MTYQAAGDMRGEAGRLRPEATGRSSSDGRPSSSLTVLADDATTRMLDQAEADVSAESTMTADGLSHLLAATRTRDAYR